MQQQNAVIYVCKEANCQLKTDTEGHRGLCRYQDVMMACCHIVTVICLQHHRVSLSLCNLATFNNDVTDFLLFE